MGRSVSVIGPVRLIAIWLLAISDDLVSEAKKIGGHKSKNEAVTAALEEYVRRRNQLRILDLEGTVDYDYKAARRGK